MGDPTCHRLTGLVINQSDLPWWATGILNWIGMVQAIQQAPGKLGKVHGEILKDALETGAPRDYTDTKTGKRLWMSGPASIYAVYQSFVLAVELEAER